MILKRKQIYYIIQWLEDRTTRFEMRSLFNGDQRAFRTRYPTVSNSLKTIALLFQFSPTKKTKPRKQRTLCFEMAMPFSSCRRTWLGVFRKLLKWAKSLRISVSCSMVMIWKAFDASGAIGVWVNVDERKRNGSAYATWTLLAAWSELLE